MLSLNKLAQSLLKDEPSFNLVRYINNVQGFELRRLNYDDAAAAIGVSSRTVGRLVKKLADRGILVVEGDKLRISESMQISE